MQWVRKPLTPAQTASQARVPYDLNLGERGTGSRERPGSYHFVNYLVFAQYAAEPVVGKLVESISMETYAMLCTANTDFSDADYHVIANTGVETMFRTRVGAVVLATSGSSLMMVAPLSAFRHYGVVATPASLEEVSVLVETRADKFTLIEESSQGEIRRILKPWVEGLRPALFEVIEGARLPLPETRRTPVHSCTEAVTLREAESPEIYVPRLSDGGSFLLDFARDAEFRGSWEKSSSLSNNLLAGVRARFGAWHSLSRMLRSDVVHVLEFAAARREITGEGLDLMLFLQEELGDAEACNIARVRQDLAQLPAADVESSLVVGLADFERREKLLLLTGRTFSSCYDEVHGFNEVALSALKLMAEDTSRYLAFSKDSVVEPHYKGLIRTAALSEFGLELDLDEDGIACELNFESDESDDEIPVFHPSGRLDD